MFTEIIYVACMTAALIEASPVNPATRNEWSAYDEVQVIPSGRKVKYQISYDLASGNPTDVHEYVHEYSQRHHAVAWEKKHGSHRSHHIVHKFSKSAKGAIGEGVGNLGKEVDSVVGIGGSLFHGVKTILDSNVKLVASIPKVGLDTFDSWFKK